MSMLLTPNVTNEHCSCKAHCLTGISGHGARRRPALQISGLGLGREAQHFTDVGGVCACR